MATLTKFNIFTQDLCQKVHNLASDTLKVMLSNTAPVVTNSVKADIVANEIASTSNGYTAGGSQITITSCTQSSGTTKLILADLVFTQSGANAMGPFRYAILYNDSPSGSPTDPLIGWWDYLSSVTLGASSGETFTIDCDPSNGVLTLG